MKKLAVLFFALWAGLSGLAEAQTVWRADLVGSGDQVTLANPTGTLSLNGNSIVSGFPVQFEVTCLDGLACADLTLFKGTSGVLGTVDGTKKTFLIGEDLLSGGGQLSVRFGQREIGVITVAAPAAPDNGSNGENTSSVDLASLLRRQCDVPEIEPTYDRERINAEDRRPVTAADRATGFIVVNPFGQVLVDPSESLDENDSLTVIVLADPDLAPLLRIKRKSALRTPGVLRTIGADTQVTVPAAQAGGGCAQVTGKFRDLAPGTAEFEILAQTGGEQTQVGSFDMIVNALYSGILSFGPIQTDVVDRSFKLAPDPEGTGKIIVASENGDEETLYTVLYTPFIWGKRDVEKRIPRSLWWHRVNPTLGITVDDFSDNALAGITIDWGTILFTAGVHYSRVNVLNTRAGVQEGGPFTGEEDEIPTQKRWERGTFVGVSIDLRAAAQLLGAVARGATGGGSS